MWGLNNVFLPHFLMWVLGSQKKTKTNHKSLLSVFRNGGQTKLHHTSGAFVVTLLSSFFTHFLSSSRVAEPQRRTEDRSSSRMLWPSSSASKEVSGSTESSLFPLIRPPPPPPPPTFHLPLLSIMCSEMSACGWITASPAPPGSPPLPSLMKQPEIVGCPILPA